MDTYTDTSPDTYYIALPKSPIPIGIRQLLNVVKLQPLLLKESN